MVAATAATLPATTVAAFNAHFGTINSIFEQHPADPQPPALSPSRLSCRYKDSYRDRVERQYRTVNPHATAQVSVTSARARLAYQGVQQRCYRKVAPLSPRRSFMRVAAKHILQHVARFALRRSHLIIVAASERSA